MLLAQSLMSEAASTTGPTVKDAVALHDTFAAHSRWCKQYEMSRKLKRWPQLWTPSLRRLAASARLKKMPQPCLEQPCRLQQPSAASMEQLVTRQASQMVKKSEGRGRTLATGRAGIANMQRASPLH